MRSTIYHSIFTLLIVLFTSVITEFSNTSGFNNAAEVSTFIDSLRAGGGISFDNSGNLYVSDYRGEGGPDNPNGTTVYKVTPDKEITIFTNSVKRPTGNKVGPDGALYVSSSNSNEIIRVEKNGKASVYAKEVAWPNALVFDKAGNLFTPNYMNMERTGPGRTLYRISPYGKAEQFVKNDLLNGGVGLEMDEQGNLYVANWNDRRIIKISPDRKASVLAEIPGDDGEFIAHLVYHDKHLYVAGTNTGRIFKVSLTGQVTPFAGKGEQGYKDGKIDEALFGFVNGLALHPNGKDLYVLETNVAGNNPFARIRVISLNQSK